MNTEQGYLLDGALGYRLRIMRHERGLTLKQVAIELDTSTSALSDIERHVSTPSIRRLWQLCRVYRVEMWQVLHPDWEALV